MKGKITAVLFILVFLLVVAVVFTFLTSLDRRREAEANQPVNNDVVVTENTPAPTEAPVSVSAAPYEAPSQGSAVIATPTPAAPIAESTPEPAVMETPVPVPVENSAPGGVVGLGTLLGSGSFTSRTGAHIDIRTDWEARISGENEISVAVTVTLNSYSIHVNALPGSVKIALNGQYVSLDSPEIHYDSNTALLSTPLASQSFTVQLPEGSSRDLDLQTEWHWGGTYGGMDIPVIECGGTFTVQR